MKAVRRITTQRVHAGVFDALAGRVPDGKLDGQTNNHVKVTILSTRNYVVVLAFSLFVFTLVLLDYFSLGHLKANLNLIYVHLIVRIPKLDQFGDLTTYLIH